VKGKVVAISAVVIGGLLIALALAFLISPFASSQPDGLNKVAIDQGFSDTGSDHATADGPLAGYETKGVSNERISKGVAGIIGVALTFAIGTALFLGVRMLHRRSGSGSVPALPVAGGEVAGGP